MHNTVPTFIAALDEDAHIGGGQALHIVVEGRVCTSGEQVKVRSGNPSIGLDAGFGQGSMEVVINTLFTRQKGHAEVNEVVDLFKQDGFFLLSETLKDAGTGDIQFDVAHQFLTLQSAVDQSDFAGGKLLWHPV